MDLGALSSVAHVQSLLQTVQDKEPDVQAWAHLDPTLALEQARLADARRSSGVRGALLGLAVGLKDIVDTADMPTENGTALHAGRRPSRDAALVTRLREAGAVMMGKTVTTELATYAPGKTRNPHRLSHTPGGSSSGSAAAVACGMVPLAIGTQTNGSTIRPAAFCGVVGFKPTRATIDRTGVLVQSPSFDTVGLFARTVDDVALLWEVLSGSPPQPMGSRHQANTPDRWVWMPGPLRKLLESGVEDALVRQVRSWGVHAGPPDLPVATPVILDLHRLIMEAEIARHFDHEYAVGADQLSASLRGQIERGRCTEDSALEDARRELSDIQAEVDAWMQAQGIDGWITASAPGAAPSGLDSTGNPIFCTLGTALDLPALQLPGLESPDGMPLGIQLIAARGSDPGLLRFAESRLSSQLA